MLNGVYRVVVLWFWMVRPHRATDSIETKGILCVLLRILCLFRHSSLSGNKRNGGRDVNGNRGFAATEMKLYGTIIISYDHTDFTSNRFAGAGIYVTGSGDVFSTAVVNNTVIRLACATCPLNFSWSHPPQQSCFPTASLAAHTTRENSTFHRYLIQGSTYVTATICTVL